MVNGLHLYSAFLTSGHSRRFTILPNIHLFMHTFTHRLKCQPCKATASSSGAVRVRYLAQGYLNTLGGAGDETSNLLFECLRTYTRRRRPTSKRSPAPASDPADDAAVERASVRCQADRHDVVCERDCWGQLEQADVVVVPRAARLWKKS